VLRRLNSNLYLEIALQLLKSVHIDQEIVEVGSTLCADCRQFRCFWVLFQVVWLMLVSLSIVAAFGEINGSVTAAAWVSIAASWIVLPGFIMSVNPVYDSFQRSLSATWLMFETMCGCVFTLRDSDQGVVNHGAGVSSGHQGLPGARFLTFIVAILIWVNTGLLVAFGNHLLDHDKEVALEDMVRCSADSLLI
jgi:hypothetical protein